MLSADIVALIQTFISEITSNDIPSKAQGRCIKFDPLPSIWKKVHYQGEYIYFNTKSHELQKAGPGVGAEEIECFDKDQLIDFLKRIGFQRGGFLSIFFGRPLIDIVDGENITGEKLLKMSYKGLIDRGVPEDDAAKLRTKLAILQLFDDVFRFDEVDTCFWAKGLGVTQETIDKIKSSGITGRRLVKSGYSGHSEVAFSLAGITNEDDIEKIQNEIGSLRGNQESSRQERRSSILNALILTDKSYYISLRESLREAEYSEKDIKVMLDRAKEKWMGNSFIQNCGFSEEEAAAIYVYTYDFGSGNRENNPYRKVNDVLRTGNIEKLPNFRGYILHLLSALRKLPRFPNGVTLYRGVDLGTNTLKVGDKLSWPAFSSSTKKIEGAKKFIENTSNHALFKIISGNFVGYDVSIFSAFGTEGEVILEPETMLRVKEVTDGVENFPNVKLITVEVPKEQEPLLIDEVVENFRIAMSVGKWKNFWSGWIYKPCVYVSKLSALNFIGPLQYCSFQEAFDNAGFGCRYDKLNSIHKKNAEDKRGKPINSEGMLKDYDDALAIFSYTVNAGEEKRPYLVVNKALADRDVSATKVYPYIYHLLGALRKLPPYDNSDKTLYRGINGGYLNESTHQVGMTLTWPAFTSTTTKKEKAQGFVSKNSIKKKVIFEITGNVRGYDITDFSEFSREGEVLLEPENVFKIIGIERNPDITVYRVEAQKSDPINPDSYKLFINKWEVRKDSNGRTRYENKKTGDMRYDFPEFK